MTDYDPATHGDVDIIFAGGGTAACVAAGRLAKHNPDLRILLIERGPNSFENPAVRNPVLYPTHLLPDSKTALFWQAQPSEHLNKRAVVVPSGGTLGGGSAINFMMYTRAQRVDYDSWNTPGWAADDLIPLSNKVETYHNDNPGVDQTKHGHEGPIHVSDGGFRSDSAAEFLATVKQMGKHDIVDQEQFDNTVNCFSTWQRYVSKDGKRQDAAYTYLYPLAQGGQHPNLFVRTDAEVVRILFDKSSGGAPRAEGVQYRLRQEDGQGELVTVSAKKLVVASAGALGTPLLLERSGVGSAEVLKKANIPQVAEVAGVGETYQDHHLILYPYKVSLPPDQTVDGLLSGRQDMAAAISSKIPIVGWNAIDICSKLRMTDEEVKAQPERFQKLWQRDFVGGAFESRPLMLLGVVSGFLGDHSNIDANQHIMMGCYTGYPWSRGSIHTKSADSLTDYDFDSGFFSDESDVNTQIWGYKISREITRRLPYSIGELDIGHPKFKEGSPAKLSDADYKKSGSEVADIVYSAEDDAAIEAWVRDNVNTTWHSLGTCAMRPQADGGVVDANLNVYGTKGLKIADLSMVPENVGANTNNTALTVGEKAATIIAAELGVAI